MKRRDFSLAASALVAAGGLAGKLASAQAARPVAGTDYLQLSKPAAVDAGPDRIEVIEFFWYSCPHCNLFEPKLEAWAKQLPSDVSLRRVPVAFRDNFVPEQRLYYTLEAMGRLGDLHRKVFLTIHAERQNLNNPQAIADWAAKQGLDRAKFMEQFNSFGVATKARRATQLQEQYEVQGVPAMGVAGRYYTDGELAKNMDRALLVTDYLIAQVRASMPPRPAPTPAKAASSAPAKAASARTRRASAASAPR